MCLLFRYRCLHYMHVESLSIGIGEDLLRSSDSETKSMKIWNFDDYTHRKFDDYTRQFYRLVRICSLRISFIITTFIVSLQISNFLCVRVSRCTKRILWKRDIRQKYFLLSSSKITRNSNFHVTFVYHIFMYRILKRFKKNVSIMFNTRTTRTSQSDWSLKNT